MVSRDRQFNCSIFDPGHFFGSNRPPPPLLFPSKVAYQVGKGDETVSLTTNMKGKISQISLGKGLKNNLKKTEQVLLRKLYTIAKAKAKASQILAFF